MTSRERVRKAIRFEGPDRIPTDVWVLPAALIKHGARLVELLNQYPTDFHQKPFSPAPELDPLNRAGTYRDEWGSVWRNETPGMLGQVQDFPLGDWAGLKSLKVPYETIEKEIANISIPEITATKRFTTFGIPPIFHRMNWLRPTSELLMDIVDEKQEVSTLIAMIHDFNMRWLRRSLEYPFDGHSIGDDWGSQHQLLIPPRIWRKLFKPCYREYIDLVHRAGRQFLFHSDGYIMEIIEDMIEIGIDALNCQMWVMDVGEMGRRFAGRLTFWGELDRQQLLPRGSRGEIEAAVKKAIDTFHTGRGGYICQCEFGPEVPLENVRAVLESWEKFR